MTAWVWHHIIGPVLSGAFAAIPLWAWLIIAGLAIGTAFRFFGWQGVVGAVAGALSFLSYREGWKARDSLAHEHVAGPDALPPEKPRRATKRAAPKKPGLIERLTRRPE